MMTYTLANKILEGMAGRSSIFGSSIYLGLSTTAPSRNGTGFTEPSTSNGYKRVLLGMNGQSTSYKMGTASAGGIKNSETVYFPEATGSWGTCTYYLLFDAQTNGNLLAYGTLTDSITPTNGTVPLIRTEELQMTLS
jgi:hypothetical protein